MNIILYDSLDKYGQSIKEVRDISFCCGKMKNEYDKSVVVNRANGKPSIIYVEFNKFGEINDFHLIEIKHCPFCGTVITTE